MYSFDLIGKHIWEIDAVMDSWISELGLSYAHKRKFAIFTTSQNKLYLIFVKIIEKEAGLNLK